MGHDNITNQWYDWLNKKKNRATRAAHVLVQFFCQTTRRGIFICEVLTRMRARSSKSLTIILCIKTFHAKLARGHFGYSLQRDYHGIVAKTSSTLKICFKATFLLQQRVYLPKLGSLKKLRRQLQRKRHKIKLCVIKVTCFAIIPC